MNSKKMKDIFQNTCNINVMTLHILFKTSEDVKALSDAILLMKLRVSVNEEKEQKYALLEKEMRQTQLELEQIQLELFYMRERLKVSVSAYKEMECENQHYRKKLETIVSYIEHGD